MDIELGCFTRPWGEAGYTLEQALAGIAAAGYGTVGLRPLSPDETEDDIAQLRATVEGHGLRAGAVFGNPDLSLDEGETIARFRREVELAGMLGVDNIVLLGSATEAEYERWYTAVERCLDAARDEGVILLLKPHGGLSALAEDLLRAVERFDHPNFGICYDPGNIYYYTGERAEEDLPKVAEHVRAMCVKDEVGGKHGEVMITPGTGVVDFGRIFSILSGVGFSGPCWVECVGGKTLAEVNAEAGKARDFIIGVAG